jgi:biotin synthase-related radical SAM superfamily protein
VIRQNIMGGRMRWSKAVHLRAARKQRVRDRKNHKIYPVKTHPQ